MMMYPYPHDALQAVKSLAFQRLPLNLVGNFKGLHFIEKIEPLKIGVDTVVFRAPRLQVCATLRNPVYLYSRVLPETVRASPQMINCTAMELRLTDFTFNGNLWFDRLEQRVQPERPIPTLLTVHKSVYSATLKDISHHGAGLMLYVGDQPELELLVNTPLDLRLELSPQTRLSLHGRVVCRKRVGTAILYLGVRIYPTQDQARWLENYIARRKANILRELDQQAYQRMEPQQVKDLYF
ncbi:MAG: PilZ domain-containing protein [Chloroflexota bacterium]|jgi:hypothetical protein